MTWVGTEREGGEDKEGPFTDSEGATEEPKHTGESIATVAVERTEGDVEGKGNRGKPVESKSSSVEALDINLCIDSIPESIISFFHEFRCMVVEGGKGMI